MLNPAYEATTTANPHGRTRSAAAMAVAMRAPPTPRAIPGRSAPLGGMVSIRFGVHHVVDEVGARGHHAEDEESCDHAYGRMPFAEHARGGGRHEDQEVLGPLPRTRRPDEQAQGRNGRGWTDAGWRHDAVMRHRLRPRLRFLA